MKKNRKEEKKFFVEGKRIVDEGLKSDYECELVILSNSFKTSNPDILKQLIRSGNSQKMKIMKNYVLQKIPRALQPYFIKKILIKNPTSILN